jgi:hypothetical protein
MITRLSRRHILLGSTLLLTLAATVYISLNDRKTTDDANVATAIAKPDKGKPTTSYKTALNAATVATPTIRVLQNVSRDIFAIPHKEPEIQQKPSPVTVPPPIALPAPVIPVIPPQPTAPPLPFTFIGKLGEDGQYTVFLSANGKNYAVKTGELIAQIYRVEEIKPPILTVMYLPMNMKQTMQIGEAN